MTIGAQGAMVAERRGAAEAESVLDRLPEILFEIGKVIGSDEALGSTLSTISQLVTRLVGAQACSIMLVDERRQRLLAKAAYGLARGDISVVSFGMGEGVAGWVAQTRTPALIDDVTCDERYVTLSDSENRIRSMACVPLAYRDLVGVMTATSPAPGAFSPADVELMVFVAKTIALDIDNIRLRRLAITDKLTGAFNREYLGQRLPAAVDQAAERGDALSIAMIDVDHFKSFNDRFGHDAGDEVLAEIAVRLRGATRSEDVLVRYGGEEFLLLLPGASAELARDVGERMRDRVGAAPVTVGDESLSVRISVGVAELSPGESPGALIRRADAALYAAKAAGRNRVEVAT